MHGINRTLFVQYAGEIAQCPGKQHQSKRKEELDQHIHKPFAFPHAPGAISTSPHDNCRGSETEQPTTDNSPPSARSAAYHFESQLGIPGFSSLASHILWHENAKIGVWECRRQGLEVSRAHPQMARWQYHHRQTSAPRLLKQERTDPSAERSQGDPVAREFRLRRQM